MLRKATLDDMSFVNECVPKMDANKFKSLLTGDYIFIIENESANKIGILAYFELWEKLPFIEHIIITPKYRNKGYGTKSLLEFEKLIKNEGYKMILLSTQIDQKAQFLYRKLGYIDCGGLTFESTPFDQPLEVFMKKYLS